MKEDSECQVEEYLFDRKETVISQPCEHLGLPSCFVYGVHPLNHSARIMQYPYYKCGEIARHMQDVRCVWRA